MTGLLTSILVLKEHMKKIYAGYSGYIDKAFRFVLSLLIVTLINRNIGFMDALNNPFLIVGLAVLCAFIPMHFIVFISAIFVILHMVAVSVEIAAVTALVMILIFILYLRFTPREAVVVLITPLAFALKIPYLVPLVMGLTGTPLSAVSVGSGVFIYYIIANMAEYGPAIMSAGTDSSAYNLDFFMEKVFQNKLVLLTVLTFVLVVVVVYAIKRLSADYSWAIAVGVGALLNILMMLTGDLIFDINNSYPALFAGTIISALLAFLVQSFVFSVDYTRTERVQFEDDEYYYFVKAVPKVSMTVEDKQVKRINRRKYMNFKRRTESMDHEDLFMNAENGEKSGSDSDF